MNDEAVLIVGLGNTLAGDDGVGPTVIAELRHGPLPAGVRAEVLGTDSLRLPGVWRGEPEVWLVDAVRRGAPPGTVHRIEPDELADLPQRTRSAHHPSLPENLRWLRLARPELAGVRFLLWGIEPVTVDPGEGLSAPAAAGVVDAARQILDALRGRVRS